jgi:hypothetical protein
MELFGCQTCENCYHAECMIPSLDVNEVPSFWFCPHCVDRERHIPPSPTSDSVAVYLSPTSLVETPDKTSDGIEKSAVGIQHAGQMTPVDQATILERSTDKLFPNNPVEKSRPNPTDTALDRRLSKFGRSKRSSPPRKKSKYSTFSIEVDKALAVLHSELETAAKYGKSEDNLQNKIQDLEQNLKLQNGQMMLSSRELEALRKRLADERSETSRLKIENVGYRDENRKLFGMVQQKDAELKDWQAKLRSMMGGK